MLKLSTKFKKWNVNTILYKKIHNKGHFGSETKIENNSNNAEKYIYILSDKFSVTPEKEIKIKKEIQRGKVFYSKEINYSRKINFFSFKDHYVLSKKYLTKVLLPRDYPKSVKSGYYDFSKYHFYSMICFHVMNFLSSQALINSLEISRGASLFLSAGMNWVLKDGIGQIGSIFFTVKYSNSIERDLKKWRVISMLMFNGSIFFEISTLWKPQYFLISASIATLLKLSAFVSNSSSRAGIFSHFGNQNNITDITNKFFAQNNLSFLIGSTIGIAVSFFIPITFKALLPTISILSIIHVCYAYKSTVQIALNDLNKQRAFYIANEYMSSNSIPDPISISKKERFYFNKLDYLKFCNYPLEKIFGAEKNNNYLDQIINTFKESKFLSYVEKKYSYMKKKYYYKIYTFMRLDAENIDIFLAFIYSIKLFDFISRTCQDSIDKIDEFIVDSMKVNLEWVNSINKNHLLLSLKEKQWDPSFYLLEEKYGRYHLLFK